MRKWRRLPREGQQRGNRVSSSDSDDVPTKETPDSEGPPVDSFPLHTAVLTRSLPLIKSVIASGPYINSRIRKSHQFQTPLHLLFLLATHVPYDEGGDYDSYFNFEDGNCLYRDPSETSTIPFGKESAAKREEVDKEIFDVLVDAGADVTAKDLEGNTMLHLVATRKGAKWMVERLLSKGAKIDENREVDDNERAQWEAGVAEAVEAAGRNTEGLEHGPQDCCGMHSQLMGILSGLSGGSFGSNSRWRKVRSTALHFGCENGSDEVVASLLSAGADIQVEDDDQNTILQLAVNKDHTAIAKGILEEMDNRGWSKSQKKEFIDSKDRWKSPVLFNAVGRGNLPMIELILKEHPNLGTMALHGHTVLNRAKESTLPFILPLVRDVIVPKFETENEKIERETVGGEQIMVPILEHKDSRSRTALSAFCEAGDLESMILLLDAGASIHSLATKDDRGLTAIHKAAWSGHSQFLQAFVDYFMGTSEKATSSHMLQNASPARKEEELKALLNAKGPNDLTPLMFTVMLMENSKGQFEGAQCLLTLKSKISPDELLVEVNAREADSQSTALHLAVPHAPGAEIVNLLVAAGADINAQSDDGWTPLHTAAAYGGGRKLNESVCGAVVRALIDAGANVEAFSEEDGRRPLHMACFKGRTASVTELLAPIPGKDPIDLASKDVRGWTPLHFAVFYGHEEVTGLLLEAAKSRSTSVLESLLLSKIADNDPSNHGGSTVLHLVVAGNCTTFTRMMIVDRILRDAAWEGLGEDFLQTLSRAKDAQGCTALDTARNIGNEVLGEAIAEKLVEVTPG